MCAERSDHGVPEVLKAADGCKCEHRWCDGMPTVPTPGAGDTMPLISAPDSGVRMPTFPSARVIPATVPKEDREAVARGAMSRIASTARVDSARTIPFPRVEDIVRYQAEPGGIESDD